MEPEKKEKKGVPSITQEAILMKTNQKDDFIDKSKVVKGYDFNKGVDYDKMFQMFKTIGFQASRLGNAIDIVNKMLNCKEKCKIYLGYTSNMISCGVREVVRFLVQHKLVDVVVTTCGGIEEDIMKCLADTYMGEFSLDGEMLRKSGVNRIGNLLVPNDNYCKFEKWINPILKDMFKEQKEKGTIWSPSKMIRRFGKEINNEESVYYWCYKNNIPVFCPAITDGSIGDMIFFSSYANDGFIVDIVQDILEINKSGIFEKKTGMVIVGAGLIKHHICNANLMRNGADYSVFINTSGEYDGSDAGARPDEAVSWGKIRVGAECTKIFGDASLVFPLLVSQSFAKFHHSGKKRVMKNPKEEDEEEEEKKE